jgi:Tfp pilus assembly protein PilE
MKSPKRTVITNADYARFISKNSEKYLSKFDNFKVGEVDSFRATWHWPAFFVPFFWMLYRKLYGWAILAFFIGIIPYIGLLAGIVWAMVANYIYYKHAKKKLLEIKQQHPTPKTQQAVMAVKGGTSSAALIIAVAFVGLIAVAGILSAISIPAYMDYTVRSKISDVTSGFDALAQAACEYHAAEGEFPAQDYPIDDLASLSQIYGTFSCLERTSKDDITYRFTFNNAISNSLNGRTLDMQITYDQSEGYVKRWLSTSTLPAKFWPRE